MNVAVVGMGYVGLVTGACLAEMGNRVWGIDIDKERIERLKKGISPIYEPGLEELLHNNLKAGRLIFSTLYEEAVKNSLVIFLALPTPSQSDGSADLRYLEAAVREIAPFIDGYRILVNKSTVPVGTAAKIQSLINGLTPHSVDVVSNPEFLKEGAAVDDFMKPDRVIIGTESERAIAILSELYAPFMRTQERLLVMRAESAELAKYAANAFLAMKVAFINEISRLCERVKADVWEVRAGLITDDRIGKHFLFPSLGFGGSCFPKDLRALAATSRELSLELPLINATIASNEAQKEVISRKVVARFGDRLAGIKLALWGLAFKANTDDVRESPALVVAERLLTRGVSLTVYDPQAMESARKILGDRVEYASSGMEALKGVDGLIIATEWNQFRHPDFEEMKRLMSQPIIFDGRNLYNWKLMKEKGFEYYGIGTGEVLDINRVN